MSRLQQLGCVFSQAAHVATARSLPRGERSRFVARYMAGLPRLAVGSSADGLRTTSFLGDTPFVFRGNHTNLVLDHVRTHLTDYAPYHLDASVVVDVGASFGTFALMVNRLTPQATVYAFEPSVESYDLLARNTAGVANIHTIHAAVGASPDTVRFHFDPEKPEWSSVGEGAGEGYDVDQVSLDSFVTENDISRIDLLKIDVEGYESEVLRGAEKALTITRNVIVETEVLRVDNLPNVSTVMGEHGFRLAGIGDLNRIGDQLASLDLIFERRDDRGAPLSPARDGEHQKA